MNIGMNDLSICLSEYTYTFEERSISYQRQSHAIVLSITITCEIFHVLDFFFQKLYIQLP
jgi:hypothetical protein